MAFKMLVLSFSVLLFVKATLGKIDCDNHPFEYCVTPKVFFEVPLEISEFHDGCEKAKSYFRCINDVQVQCGTEKIILFPSPDLFEDVYSTLSEICEEGTFLNLLVTDHLKCYNETFSKTKCHDEAEAFVEPLIKRLREDEEFGITFDIFCLESMLVNDCSLRAVSENCGKLAEETMLEILLRSKSFEYDCSAKHARVVLDEMDNLDLSEDQKKGLIVLLEKLVE